MPTSKIVYLGNLRNDVVHLQSGTIIQTDAPSDNLGKGERFSPTDLTATSLGVCITTTLAIGANGRNWEIISMEAEVTKIMSSEPPRRISEIIVDLRLNLPDLNDEKRRLVEKVAHSCPVALSLHPDVKQTVNITYL
jgi:uncharacterized OsmC-like protein